MPKNVTKLRLNNKNIVSLSYIVRTDKKEANNISKRYNNVLKQGKKGMLFFTTTFYYYRGNLYREFIRFHLM